jgi:hypothetical protein
MFKKLMEERCQKMKEMDEVLEKLGVLYAETMDIQQRTNSELIKVLDFRSGTARPGSGLPSVHGCRQFPHFFNTGAVHERILTATMAAIGKGAEGKSLHEQALKDMEWAVGGGMING